MAKIRDPKTGRFMKALVMTTPEPEVVVEVANKELVLVSEVEINNSQKNTGVNHMSEVGVKSPVEDKVETVETAKTGSKKKFSKENSRADAIEIALINGAASIDEIVEAVMSVRLNDDPKNVKAQVGAIIRDIKSGRGRWKKYDVIQTEELVQIVTKE